MARKMVISESFKDGEPEAVMTARVPKTLYRLIFEDSEAQGIQISVLLRDILGLYYLPEHLKTKAASEPRLASLDVALLESLRSHVREVMQAIDEIDRLRGKEVPPALEEMVKREVKRHFEVAWEQATRKKGGKR